MSETLIFSGGGFQLPTELPRGATPYSVEKTEIDGQDVFVIASEPPGKTIKELDLAGDTDGTPVVIDSSVKTLTAKFGDSDDTLIINAPKSKFSDISLGDGEDDFSTVDDSRFRQSSVNTGSGDDSVVFGGNVNKVTVDLGTGADELTFQAKAKNVDINLGDADESQDTVRFEAGDGSFKNIVITGADENDVLFIGSSEYNYEAASNLWVNGSDPNDTRNFS